LICRIVQDLEMSEADMLTLLQEINLEILLRWHVKEMTQKAAS